ncbi:molybdenum cofactor guanylyltransferase [Actinopolymorpha sp. B11F2]|uniref:molybdenum cofactor guanylyltransferase n=1 Tax=Actinopolymorpha sp. B11F2 TaxID=3160862 RepID=UPI0032E50ED4
MGDQGSADFDVVVLAGGTARRFGGADKVLLPVAGRPMLERVVSAGAAARTVVVVGPQRPLPPGAPTVRWTREQPAGSGPLAAVAAGLELCGSAIVVVLAGDMPLLDSFVVRTLVRTVAASAGAEGPAPVDRSPIDRSPLGRSPAAEPAVDGVVLVDAEGRRQPLAAAYVRASLQRAFATIGDPADRPMRLLLDQLHVATVTDPRAALDCDTPESLARADHLADSPPDAEPPPR